jgi:hypothetical protein
VSLEVMKKLFKGENVSEKQTIVGKTLRVGWRSVVVEETIAEGRFSNETKVKISCLCASHSACQLAFRYRQSAAYGLIVLTCAC